MTATHKRGRPHAETKAIVFAIKLRLYPGIDDLLIAYLQNAPHRLRARYVVRAMQSGADVLPVKAAAPEEDELSFDGLMQ
ncbi:MAG: hypothetical protein HZB17_01935 [Chloroflexi bacterium]|nr:hypothetical protein [Chloroflexota bacterium]MBI5080051.1 hypothetical protein [Chloroflexota bacterium]MBI5348013.1 hypothetical protein [Chloroflexota bacterium]